MVNRLLFALVSLLGIATPIHAQSFMCPSTYELINIDDSEAQVATACGKPTSATSKDVPKLISEPTEQWYYQGVQRESVSQSGSVNIPADLNLDISPTAQPPLIITFDKNGRVINVNFSGSDVGSTTLCGGNGKIKTGDNQAKVRSLCGTSNLVNKGTKTRFVGTIKQTTWRYNFNEFQPPVVLTFEEGKLTKIQQ